MLKENFAPKAGIQPARTGRKHPEDIRANRDLQTAAFPPAKCEHHIGMRTGKDAADEGS